jgi:hypothetical protein
MGEVVWLDRYRGRRGDRATPVDRLDQAVTRLDPLVRQRDGRLTPTIERELRAIAVAVSSGNPREAADRAERLIGLLAHPAASG